MRTVTFSVVVSEELERLVAKHPEVSQEVERAIVLCLRQCQEQLKEPMLMSSNTTFDARAV